MAAVPDVSAPNHSSQSWSNFSLAGSISQQYTEQVRGTTLAVEHWFTQHYRQLRMAFKDLRAVCKQLFESKKPGGKRRGSIIEALADTTPLNCYLEDQCYLQETYFLIAILMVALSLGGIVGNLWSEFTWAPQINLMNAIIIIVLLPTEIWLGMKDLSETFRKRRSELYFKMFFVGFSMGKICSYNLMTTAPRMFCPLALAYLLEKIDHKKMVKTPARAHRIRGTRLELFLAIAVCTIVACWMLLLIDPWQLNFNSLFFSFLASGINLQLLFAHFQLFYYGLFTLRENWAQATMKDEEDNELYQLWDLDDVNPYLSHADLCYAFLVLCIDVIVTAAL